MFCLNIWLSELSRDVFLTRIRLFVYDSRATISRNKRQTNIVHESTKYLFTIWLVYDRATDVTRGVRHDIMDRGSKKLTRYIILYDGWITTVIMGTNEYRVVTVPNVCVQASKWIYFFFFDFRASRRDTKINNTVLSLSLSLYI